jgi:hypothetical protein
MGWTRIHSLLVGAGAGIGTGGFSSAASTCTNIPDTFSIHITCTNVLGTVVTDWNPYFLGVVALAAGIVVPEVVKRLAE